MSEYASLPLQGREEREHLYRWISEEEVYVAGKFDDQRENHDDSLREGLDLFWERQVMQYMDRAKMFFDSIEDAKTPEDRRQLEMLGQQALAKGMMTWKGLVESSVRVFGPLPKPGVPSGTVEPWE